MSGLPGGFADVAAVDEPSAQPALRRVWRWGVPGRRKAAALLDHGERPVLRLLWVFLPETTMARKRRFQYLIASTFLSDGGRDALKYGALVAVTRSSGSSIYAALIGTAALAPTALFGLYGGAIADALPKRTALAVVYGLQAALCFTVPFFLGTDFAAVLLLIFGLNLLGQISTPSEQSIAPLVASDAQMASATSLIGLASNIGTFFGTALLAPVLLKLVGVSAVFAVAGVMLGLATVRIMRVRTREDIQAPVYERPSVKVRALIQWLTDEPAVATMLLLGVIAGTATVILETLAPRYVQSVLGLDPAESVYVFAPASVGLIAALVAAPWLIERVGERTAALAGFLFITMSLCLLGLVHHGVIPLLDPVNPFRILNSLGLELGGPIRTASLLALPLGFGISIVTMSVQTYINRRVPLSHQGRTFALQSVVKNGVAIVPLLALGTAASFVGVDTVLVATPFLFIGLAFLLIRLSERFCGREPSARLDVLSSFWHESEKPVSVPPA